MGGAGRRRSEASAIGHWRGGKTHSPARRRPTTLTPRRRESLARLEPTEEIIVNHYFAEIATTIGSIRSFDDIVSGVASVAFCVCSAVLFAAVFVGAI